MVSRLFKMKRWLILLSLAAGLALAEEAKKPPQPPAPAAPPVPAVKPEPAEVTIGAPKPPAQPVAATSATPPPAPSATPAAAAAAVPDKAIPQAYSEEHYASTWRRNPFLLVTNDKIVTPGPGFAEDWELKGLIRNKGKPEALLNNKKTQEYHWVRTTEDKDGFKLLEATIDRDLHKSSVKVAKAGEGTPATFTFPEVAAAPAVGMKPGGAPGAPIRPGMPPAQPVPQQPGMQPGMQPGNPNGLPGRVNPAMQQQQRPGQPNAIGQPNPGVRRRVLIPPTKAP